jgi:hypothetical protein
MWVHSLSLGTRALASALRSSWYMRHRFEIAHPGWSAPACKRRRVGGCLRGEWSENTRLSLRRRRRQRGRHLRVARRADLRRSGPLCRGAGCLRGAGLFGGRGRRSGLVVSLRRRVVDAQECAAGPAGVRRRWRAGMLQAAPAAPLLPRRGGLRDPGAAQAGVTAQARGIGARGLVSANGMPGASARGGRGGGGHLRGPSAFARRSRRFRFLALLGVDEAAEVRLRRPCAATSDGDENDAAQGGRSRGRVSVPHKAPCGRTTGEFSARAARWRERPVSSEHNHPGMPARPPEEGATRQ